jgi:DNA-binding NarL/FixJ family response regulator
VFNIEQTTGNRVLPRFTSNPKLSVTMFGLLVVDDDPIVRSVTRSFVELTAIIVVVSNPLVRRMVLNVVADLASDIRECASAAEAIAAYAGDSPDFVLADADGMQVARRIKNAHPEARVIVLGDFDDPDLRAQAFQAGASHY